MNIDNVIDEVIRENPSEVSSLRSGGPLSLIGFLLGKALQKTRGKCDPKIAFKRLRERVGV